MGRLISNLSQWTSNSVQVTAGENLTINDLVQISGADGKSYRVRNSDAAASGGNFVSGVAQNTFANGQVVALTTVVSSISSVGDIYRKAQITDSAGNIYVLYSAASSQQLGLYKLNSGGLLLGSVVVDNTVTGIFNMQIAILSNGNIAIMHGMSTTAIYHAVYTPQLVAILPITVIAEPATSSQYSKMISLSGGGYAILFQQQTNPLLNRLTTFDNTGTLVLAATTVWTRTTTSGMQQHNMVQLSNGNLAMVISSLGTQIGTYHLITTIAGVSVLAPTLIDAAVPNTIIPISTLSGFYCIAAPNGTNTKAYVFNNSGTLQGSAFSSANTTGLTFLNCKLVNDGTKFYFIYYGSVLLKTYVTTIPTTGTNYLTVGLNPSVACTDIPRDAFYENGMIVIVFLSVPVNCYFMVYNTSTNGLVSNTVTMLNNASFAGLASNFSILPIGDNAFSFVAEIQTANTSSICIAKYAPSSVIGVAQSSATVGNLVTLATTSGAYMTNTVGGSYAKAMDFSTTTQAGNKGTIMTNGVVLRGI